MGELNKLGALVGRELVGEMRTREVLTATLVFPPLVLVIFRFSFDLGELGKVIDWPSLTPGILWTALAFAAVLCLGRSFASEKEDDRWLGLLLSPVDRGTLYLAKLVANALYLAVVALVTVPVYEIFFSVGVFQHWAGITLTVLLGLIGMAAAGTLLSAMAVNTRARETVLPLLMLPILTPVIIAATQMTSGVLAGKSLLVRAPDGALQWLVMLIAVDVMLAAAGWFLFEFVVEE